MSDVTWAAAVPLVGGMMFGARRALGGGPEWIASYEDAFGDNDRHARSYFGDPPYYELADDDRALPAGVDVVVTLCPCAGLSHATHSKFGSDQRMKQNMWMVRVAERVLGEARPMVLVGENAPNLFTPSGRAVREMLYELADEFGYNMSFAKTSTDLHGIPQARTRSFYYFWNRDLGGNPAPLLPVVRRPHPTPDAAEWLRRHGDPEDADEDVSPTPLRDRALYRHLRALYGDEWRTLGGRAGLGTRRTATLFDMLYDPGAGLDEFLRRAERGDYDDCEDLEPMVRQTKRAIEKAKVGKGVLNATPVLPSKGGTRFRSLMWKTYHSAVHPFYDRFLTYDEFRSLMDVPKDFPDVGRGSPWDANVFCQNVPTATAMDAIVAARLFCEGRLPEYVDCGTTWLRDKSERLFAGRGEHYSELKGVRPVRLECEMDGSGLREVLREEDA